MQIGLIFSNDWEVFGDGSGDYFVVQHEPLQQCLKATSDHGASMSIMAEVGQQIWGFRKLGESQEWAHEIAEAWESILADTIRAGGDVQLHLHPQWIGADFVDGSWDLDYDKWSIGRLPEAEVYNALKTGKDYLESILKPIKSDYTCHSFRAGAYCIQPSQTVIRVLEQLGFKADTSVTKGYFDASFYDYRNAHSNVLPWKIGSDVRFPSPDGSLLEIPIYSFSMIESLGLRAVLGGTKAKNLSYKLSLGVPYHEEDQKWFRERDRIRAERYPAQNRPMQQSSSHKIKGLLSSKEGLLSIVAWPNKIQLDYDYLPPNVFVKAIERIFDEKWARRYADTDLIIPVMASGHVKNMHNADNLNRILELARTSLGDRLVFWNLDQAVRYWGNTDHLKLLPSP